MVQVGQSIQDYCCDGGGMFLVLWDALVVSVPFGMPDLIIAEVISFRILEVESYGRNSFHSEICMV